MCKEVKIRKNVLVSIALTGASAEYQKAIDLDFNPDEMKVKYIQYFFEGDAGTSTIDNFVPALIDFTSNAEDVPIPTYQVNGSLLLVRLNLVNEYIGAITDTPNIQKFDTQWTIGKPVRGNHLFTIHNPDGSLSADDEGNIIIHLEFVKYNDRI